MKLLLAYRPRSKPPRTLHVFSILAGTLVSARTYCGRVRPEGEVLTVVRAEEHTVYAFCMDEVELGGVCQQCAHNSNLDIGSPGGSKDTRFERDERVLSQLKW